MVVFCNGRVTRRTSSKNGGPASFEGVLNGRAISTQEAALDVLLRPFLLAIGSIAGALGFPEAGHVPLADEAAVPVEGAMAALAIEGFPRITGGGCKLTAAVTAEMP